MTDREEDNGPVMTEHEHDVIEDLTEDIVEAIGGVLDGQELAFGVIAMLRATLYLVGASVYARGEPGDLSPQLEATRVQFGAEIARMYELHKAAAN